MTNQKEERKRKKTLKRVHSIVIYVGYMYFNSYK